MLYIQSSKRRQIWPHGDLLIPQRLEQLQGKRKIRINEKKSQNVFRGGCVFSYLADNQIILNMCFDILSGHREVKSIKKANF